MNNYLTAEDSGAAFKKYLGEIAGIPLLTPGDEIVLAAGIKTGDPEARTLMIRSNLRLVVKIALSYTNLGLPLLDLIGEGNIGLMKAVDRFDPAKGAKLSTYAIWWIEQCIKRALQNQGKIIRLPVHFSDKAFRVNRIAAQMSEALGRQPTADEISEEIGLSPADISQLTSASLRPASLDAPLDESAETEFGETVGDEREQSPFETLRAKDLQARLRSVLTVLNKREHAIVSARFGLDGAFPKTLEEVGQALGITRERIRQLQIIALAKLRQALTNDERRSAMSLKAAA